MDHPNASSEILREFIAFDSDSEDELEQLFNARENDDQQANGRRRTGHRGSVPGHRIIQRNHNDGHSRLWNDYFKPDPVYHEGLFRRRFRMSRNLFLHIANAVVANDTYFTQRRNAVGVLGLSALQKITAALRILAYRSPADTLDEYIQIGESTAIASLRRFVKGVVTVFGERYLRAPDQNDVHRLLAQNEERGFPGMLGSIDCMHWQWRNCPTAWQGMYTGHCRSPTIILEAVASRDLWIWHAFFGMPGSLNDINVLQRSPVFGALANGRAPEANYTINGHQYNMGYYLADGIYPRWSTFVKTIPCPQCPKRKHFAKMQEAARKDVERAFGVLQARFAITRGSARFWDVDTLDDIMTACIILHNMIVEENGGSDHIDFDGLTTPPTMSHTQTAEFRSFIQTHRQIRDSSTHSQLQDDLVEHLWARLGSSD
ncbi:putative nuclease HARBI1 [Tripterygium wilfordii]|uniref:putative nuclease HARBI1 n=1 Tax=Tripterygium wilfordii TaxID=458696 RepID=UPI0018F808F6|nr:putative nuclease HARBI1 [Tripterygium wilfordii]